MNSTLFFITLFSCFSIFANTVEVCNKCELTNISDALAIAGVHDSILIFRGTYYTDNIIINKPVSLVGIDYPVIHSKSGDEILTIVADSVRIEGLILKDVKTNYLKELSAIRVKNHAHFYICNNIIEDCFFAIYLEHAKKGEITGNRIHGDATVESASGNGIHGWHSKNIVIRDNTIINHRDGIYLEFVNESTIENNISHRNKRYGLHFMFSNDNTYALNTFKDNGVGVAVMFSKNIKMTSNIFRDNWGRSAYGLLLKEINDAVIADNEFTNNTIGIFVEGSNRIDYKENYFDNNGWAIKISGGCSKNVIHYNNFVDNSLDLEMNTKLSDNKIDHNYWSAYEGYDLDKDQIGDVPHYPIQLYSYIINSVPESIVLLKSFFIQILNLSEKVSPVFTPKEIIDPKPLMQIHKNDKHL